MTPFEKLKIEPLQKVIIAAWNQDDAHCLSIERIGILRKYFFVTAHFHQGHDRKVYIPLRMLTRIQKLGDEKHLPFQHSLLIQIEASPDMLTFLFVPHSEDDPNGQTLVRYHGGKILVSRADFSAAVKQLKKK